MSQTDFDVVVIGGGPSGATAANDLAQAGRRVMLLDKAGRIKPCGGAVPPRLLKDFDIPQTQLVSRAQSARMIAPSGKKVDMPVGEGPDGAGYVGMVDREHFDEWLRERAASHGAIRRTGRYESVEHNDDGTAYVLYREKRGQEPVRVSTKAVIGADGARSAVARDNLSKATEPPSVFAYHEIVKSPVGDAAKRADFDNGRCDVFYQGKSSPDFYAWVFPHGDATSIGLGSADKGFPLREAVAELRRDIGMEDCELIRHEGAPIPLKPRKRWDNGRDLVVAGDAAGVVAPASGEGIYYAMVGGRLAADATEEFLKSGNPAALKLARKRFMKEHGRTFWVLGMMQYFWYSSDKRRERFVKMCADPDVQYLTWQAYMNKQLVKAKPAAHMRIFLKDMGHLLGLSPAH